MKKLLLLATLLATSALAAPPSEKRVSALILPMDPTAEQLTLKVESFATDALNEYQGFVVRSSDELFGIPPDEEAAASLKREHVLPSNTKTMCSWKGQASYYTLFVDGDANPDAVWYYPDPKEAAAEIKDRVAFWKGVQVVE